MSTSTKTSTPKSYTLQDWQGGYESLKQEFDYWIEDIEGEIPPELNGTLFRNGPGLLDINGQKIHHPFDGDGMISRITFTQGKAHFRNRFVETEGYLAEKAAGKILYRGAFGTQKPGGVFSNFLDIKNKNIANTNVIYWGGKLLALWEGAEPHLLDAATLKTLGKEYFQGTLQSGDAFSAHPRIDPCSNLDNGQPCLVNFSIKPGLSTKINIFELDISGNIIRRNSHIVPGFAFLHDFAITPNYCIFFQNPVKFNPLPFLMGMRGAGECVKFQANQPTQIIIIPRNPQSGKVEVLETNSGFIFHHGNAFEQGDEIIIDSIAYASFPEVQANTDFRQTDFTKVPPGQLWRFSLNLRQQSVNRELLLERSCEFPSLHPERVGQNYRYLYIGIADTATGNAPLQAYVKLDVQQGTQQIWSAAPRGFVSEPIFVPRQNSTGEDDGWLLGVVYDAAQNRSDIVILDARDISKGTVAKLHLKHHIPYGLHGSFTKEVFVK